jgi:energy-converting hydrogenase Eha subunit C
MLNAIGYLLIALPFIGSAIVILYVGTIKDLIIIFGLSVTMMGCIIAGVYLDTK